jgi:hypothetical protein
MATIPKSPSTFEIPDEGTYGAECRQIVHLGTSTKSFNGEDKEVNQIELGIQLTTEKTTKGKAMMIYQKYTWSDSDNSNLVKHLRSWGLLKKGESASDFEMDTCLGKQCQVNITHSSDGKFANISGIVPLTKGQKIPKGTEPMFSLYLNDDFDQDVFDNLPERKRNKIAETQEYAAVIAGKQKGAKKAPAKKATGKK